jgi:hypothetical protein
VTSRSRPGAICVANTSGLAGDHSLPAMEQRANFRLEAARAMLEGGDDGLAMVAKRAGFG